MVSSLKYRTNFFNHPYISDVISEMQDGFDWSDFNAFEDNWLKYAGATLDGAIGGLGAGIGTTILQVVLAVWKLVNME